MHMIMHARWDFIYHTYKGYKIDSPSINDSEMLTGYNSTMKKAKTLLLSIVHSFIYT